MKQSTKRYQFLIAFFIAVVAGILVLTLAANETSADTIIVAKDGNGEHDNIQDAIDAATEGDTIRVWEGTYYENVVVNKSVSLIGNGSEETTIDAGGSGSVVKITADWAKMSGFMVTGSGTSWPDAGISVESNHNIISKNNCSNNHYGIYLSSSSDCTIENNTCNSNKDDGITLDSSDNNSLSNNICSFNDYDGIDLWSSSNNSLSNNNCSFNNDDSISLYNSSFNLLSNNTCANNGDGIMLFRSESNTLSNNSMIENGIFISGNSLAEWNTHTIDTTNSVNGKPVYYYKNTTGFRFPDGAGEVILANCTDATVENQNYSNGSVGILVGYSSGIRISNNTCSNNEHGISIESSVNIPLFDNTCNWNRWYGISLDSSSYCTLDNNTCENNDYGIYLSYSNTCTITKNTCENNGDGISLKDSDDCTLDSNTCSQNSNDGISLSSYSSACTITNNTCKNNVNGIYLKDSSACTIKKNTCENNGCGIYFLSSSDCTIEKNTCENNDYGIYLSSSSACTITKNTCSLNNEYGIRLYYSSACTIEKNTISENRVGIYLESFSFTPNVNTAHYNNIFNNTEYGIRVPGYFGFGYTINATYNWWGNESGPYHSVNNPNGKGDNVTDYVIFDPWLREPYTEKANRNVDEKTKTVSLFWSFVGFMIALSVIVVWIWFTKKRKSGMEYITDTQLGRTGVKRLKKHHWMIIGGTVLLVIGIVISIIMFTLLFKDPSEEAVWEGTYAEGEKADKKVFLDAGKYDVWSKDYDPGEVVIKDSNGRVVFRDSIGTNYEKITINGVVYVKVGSFKAEKQDTYTVTVEQASTLYITPPIKVSGIIESVCGGVIISIIGGILLVAGIIFWFKEKKKIPQHGQHQMQPYQQPPQRVQPQHLCPKCGSPLSYHHVKMNGEEYNKWYCYQCEEYAPE